MNVGVGIGLVYVEFMVVDGGDGDGVFDLVQLFIVLCDFYMCHSGYFINSFLFLWALFALN